MSGFELGAQLEEEATGRHTPVGCSTAYRSFEAVRAKRDEVRRVFLSPPRPVSCSGIIMGTYQAVAQYLDLMWREMRSPRYTAQCLQHDQAFHNYLLWTGRLSRATGGVAEGTYLFALPGSTGACKDGWDGILATQLDRRHRPCNFVELMPRLRETSGSEAKD